jgi:endonuclease/exonuclease/phosphatase family metal-dependent hydrolase
MNTSKTCRVLLIVAVAFLLYGCPVPPGAEKESKPEITLKIASINLGNFKKRMEKKYITGLVKRLKNEKIEVLAVQEVTRYPGVATRTDFIDELKNQTEWRSVFGEMANLSGRQTGNAVLSAYPIISNYNRSFDEIKSAQFQAALLAIVDAGVGTITVVSATLPDRSSEDETMQCIRMINGSLSDRERGAIISGNLPSSESIRRANSFLDVSPSKHRNKSEPIVWYSAGGRIKLIGSKSVETEFGRLIIVEIGLLRN